MSSLINFYKNIKTFTNPNQLGYIILYVTNVCNFRCNFCFYYAEIEKGRKPNELSLNEMDKISSSVGSLLQLSMTGGEPFIRKDLSEVTNIWVKNTGVRYITIPTNGWLTDKTVDYLEQALPNNPDTYFRLTFSIDGIGEEHDENRSKPGSYKKIIETVKAVKPLQKKYNNLTLDSNTVFTIKTHSKIVNILKTIKEQFDFDNMTVTYARGSIKDESLKAYGEKEYKEMNKYLSELERKKEKRFLYPLYRGVRDTAWENLIQTVFHDEFVSPCVAGRKMIVIGETGDVFPCEVLENSKIGNVRDYNYNIPNLLKSEKSRKQYQWIVDSKCKCSFECALAANVTWTPKMYPRLIKSAIKNIGK